MPADFPFVRITGLPAAEALFDPKRYERGLRAGMQAVGEDVSFAAIGLTSEHTWSGRFAAKMSVRTTGAGDEIKTQVHSSAPESAAMAHGRQGSKQPPTQNRANNRLRKWMAAKGIDASLAFVIARAIKQRGYSYHSLDQYDRAWHAVSSEAATIIRAAIAGQR